MCPNVRRVVTAVHCGESAVPDCAECRQAMADEHAFVAMIQEGLAGVRPRRRIAPRVMARIRPRRRLTWWPVAAAIVAGVVAFLAWPEKPKPVRPPPLVKTEPPLAGKVPPLLPKAPEPAPPVVIEKPFTSPEKPEVVVTPAENVPPILPEPAVEVPPPPPATVVVETPKPVVSINIKSGSLTCRGKKFSGACSLIEGEAFQVDRATVVEGPGVTLHLERGSKGHFEPMAFALHAGEGLIEALGPYELKLSHIVRSALSRGRFIASFKPDAIWIEEGAGRSGDTMLFEGQPYRLGKTIAVDRKVNLKRRPIRDAVTWATAFDKMPAGTIVNYGTMGAGVLNAARSTDGFYYASAAIHNEGNRLFVVKPTTHLRFRYWMTKSAPLTVQLFNRTKGENFRMSIPEPPAGGWVTVTVRISDLQAPNDGKAVQVAPDDVFANVQWHVGETELSIDDVQIVEVR
jgi:hypothetical protein